MLLLAASDSRMPILCPLIVGTSSVLKQIDLVHLSLQAPEDAGAGPSPQEHILAGSSEGMQGPGAGDSRGDWASWKSGQATAQVLNAPVCK